MAKSRLNTTIDDNLLNLLKEKALESDNKNINGVIEKVLKFYFSNLNVSIWELECAIG